MNNAHERDKPEDGFDRLLRSALSSDDSASGSACLDAETLAAWCDGALSPSERSFADAHVARCARCQSMLAVMARTAPADSASRTWSVRQWFMMLAPAATATTALALWFAATDAPHRVAPVPESKVAMSESDAAHRGPAHTPAETSAAASAQAAPVASADRRDESAAVAAPPAEKKRAAAGEERKLADAKETPKREEAEKSAKDALARQQGPFGGLASSDKTTIVANAPPIDTTSANNRVAGYLGNANTANANTPNANTANAPAANAAGERVNALPAAPPPPPAPARPDQQQASQTFRTGVQTGAGRGGGGAVAVQAESPLVMQQRALQEVVPSFAFAAPDASVQWRVIAQRIIQQSIDKGATWATQYTVDDKPAIVAGSAPSPTVAWIVGRLGIVLKTDDGRTWHMVTFPENVDLVGVAAVDRDTAIVTAADRRVFSTSNGGRSWTIKK
jgi:hypothetical protein